jgi:hypothetical protein
MKLSKADTEWGRAVKERDGYSCRRCYTWFPEGPPRRGLHAHHIFTRSRRRTRHDVENGVSLCYGDHRWAHANPIEFLAWMRDELGEDAYMALYWRSIKTKASA